MKDRLRIYKVPLMHVTYKNNTIKNNRQDKISIISVYAFDMNKMRINNLKNINSLYKKKPSIKLGFFKNMRFRNLYQI